MQLDKHYSIVQVGLHVIVIAMLCHVPAPVKSVSMLRGGLAICWRESLIHRVCRPLVSWTDGRLASRGRGGQSYQILKPGHLPIQPSWPHMTPPHLFIQNQIPELQKRWGHTWSHTHTHTQRLISVCKLTCTNDVPHYIDHSLIHAPPSSHSRLWKRLHFDEARTWP